MPSYPNPGDDFNLPPELLAYYSNLPKSSGDYPAGFDPTAGIAPAAAPGPPGMEGLEGGWSHIPTDPLAFIQELLTPRRVQGRTELSGGSYFGPSREMSIPQQNFAQAELLLKMLSERDAYTRGSEMGGLADSMTRTRAENETMRMPQGTEENPAFVMGDQTANIAGKPRRDIPVGPGEAMLTGAQETGTGRGSPVVDPSKMFGEVTDRLKYLEESARADETRLDMMDPGPEYDQLKARIDSTWAQVDALNAQMRGGGGPPVGQGDQSAGQGSFESPGMFGTAWDFWGEKLGDAGEATIDAFIERGRRVPTAAERDPSKMTREQLQAALQQLSDYRRG